jgi:CheY-like chemotaxis protein/HPt (histidine-containing phosphotransfer) domain-containing protein
MSAHKPCVLLIEDDLSLQRFVGAALEELPLDLIAVSSVDEGLAVLAGKPVNLILTDLMMPGRSGFDLIDALAADPALRGDAKLAVFSAGLDPHVRRRLTRPDVWRLLLKPCSILELEDCVRSALPIGEDMSTAPVPAVVVDPRSAAIDVYFGGNAALYHAFRASCVTQFHADITAGDEAIATSGLPALHRLAHSLKSVLLTLGHPIDSEQAMGLEKICEAGDARRAAASWSVLRARLNILIKTG